MHLSRTEWGRKKRDACVHLPQLSGWSLHVCGCMKLSTTCDAVDSITQSCVCDVQRNRQWMCSDRIHSGASHAPVHTDADILTNYSLCVFKFCLNWSFQRADFNDNAPETTMAKIRWCLYVELALLGQSVASVWFPFPYWPITGKQSVWKAEEVQWPKCINYRFFHLSVFICRRLLT